MILQADKPTSGCACRLHRSTKERCSCFYYSKISASVKPVNKDLQELLLFQKLKIVVITMKLSIFHDVIFCRRDTAQPKVPNTRMDSTHRTESKISRIGSYSFYPGSRCTGSFILWLSKENILCYTDTYVSMSLSCI